MYIHMDQEVSQENPYSFVLLQFVWYLFVVTLQVLHNVLKSSFVLWSSPLFSEYRNKSLGTRLLGINVTLM